MAPARKIHAAVLAFLACTGLFIQPSVYSQDTDHQGITDSFFFDTDSLLHLTLIADFESLRADVGQDPDYHPGMLRYDDRDGNSIDIEVDIRARGNFRKMPQHCNFPPLKLKFSEDDTPGTIFEEFEDLKTVSHCQTGWAEFDQYVLLEYLIYKIYNLFTDLSFRVRLAMIHYQDVNNPADSMTRYSFFIENAEDMAARNGASLLDLGSIGQNQMARDQLTLLAVFNYMVINQDYSIPILHNIELLSRDYFEPPLPVPYDFDWSGIVNIPYTYDYIDDDTHPEPVYKGPCRKRREFKKVFSQMREKRDEVFRLVSDCPYLDRSVKALTLTDLSRFYQTIDDRRSIRLEFMKNCKK